MLRIRVEAAAYRGHPVYFEVMGLFAFSQRSQARDQARSARSGQLVASDKSDLTKGSIRAPITYDELAGRVARFAERLGGDRKLLVAVVAGFGVRDQRHVLEEAGHGFELVHEADQLLQVLEAGVRLPEFVFFQAVTGDSADDSDD